MKNLRLTSPADKKELTRNIINVVMVLVTSYYIIKYNSKMFHVDYMGFGLAGIIYGLRYIPLMLVSSVGGAVPAMVCVILVFAHSSAMYSSFSYLTFIYLLVACVCDVLAKRRWFNKWYKVIPVTIFMMNLVGTFWGVVVLLLSDYGIYTISVRQVVMFFMNSLPGCLTGTILVYLVFNKVPGEILVYFGNGKYYVKPSLLTEDEKYVVEGKSRISNVVMNIIVVEALVIGIFAEIAANTLIPSLQSQTVLSAPAQRSAYSNVNSADRLESLVSIAFMEESQEEYNYFARIVRGDIYSAVGVKFSIRLAMLISMAIIPMAVFVNRFAQRRIAKPIRLLSQAMSEIYNSNDVSLSASVNSVHELDIRTSDEIEELYHAVDLTVYRLVEYIELVKTRQNIEDQLQVAQSANEAKSRFLSNMSHEIRTPINAVLGFDEMILRECEDAEILGYAKDIQNSGRTLLALINDILDFSKIEAGKMEIVPVEYEFGSLMNDIVNMSGMRAKEKNLKLNVHVNEDIPYILFGDEIRIKQCIINIITNAVKYTETGSVDLDVDFETVDDENMSEDTPDTILLKIAVTDTGIGIREDDMEKLTTAFERVDLQRNRTIEGTGLGISIVTSLLDLMNSKLEVSSEYGKGSRFSFNIEQRVVNWEPVGDFAQKVRESWSDSGNYTESFHAPLAKILVVDDTRTNLTVIQGLLKQTGMKVDVATSGVETIEKIKKEKYNIIFLDHRMPEMDGIQTFHAMEALPDNLNKGVPVIALTANAISGSREMYLKEGFTNYLSKPVDPTKLEEMILAYLPKELVERAGDEGFVPNGGGFDKEEKETLHELLRLTGVDINAAIEKCGSAKVAKDVMRDFWLSIDERSALIEKYQKSMNIKDYTIYVHGLKSSARAIGALDLADRAEYLENCGNGGDIEEIEMLTPKLLELYRSYTKRLEILFKKDESKKEPISAEELENAFASMKEFISASYFDSADDIMAMLDNYAIPEEYKEKYHKVKKLMSAVDRDGLINIL